MGTLYGVGVGPGDPELITVKAVNVLKSVDVVYTASSSKNEYSIAKNIALQYIPEKTPVFHLSFPMTKDKDKLNKCWQSHAETIMSDLDEGKNVVFLTLGDPLIYSTYGYILSYIQRTWPQTNIRTIPGISAYQAVAARVNLPLVQGDESLMVTAGTKGIDELRNLGNQVDNTVFFKAYRNIEDIAVMLRENRMEKNTVIVRKCSHPDEEIYFEFDELLNRSHDYWTLILSKRNGNGRG